jgi:rRNA-processing protein EBP2
MASAKGVASPLINVQAPSLSSESKDSDSDGDDVDEAGIENLMRALGDDGLNDFDHAQLDLVSGNKDGWETEEGESDDDVEANIPSTGDRSDSQVGEGEGEESEDEGEDASKTDDDKEGGDTAEGEEQTALPLDDIESVDEDAVHHQKIEVNNKVREHEYEGYATNIHLYQVALKQIREDIKVDPSLP